MCLLVIKLQTVQTVWKIKSLSVVITFCIVTRFHFPVSDSSSGTSSASLIPEILMKTLPGSLHLLLCRDTFKRNTYTCSTFMLYAGHLQSNSPSKAETDCYPPSEKQSLDLVPAARFKCFIIQPHVSQ